MAVTRASKERITPKLFTLAHAPEVPHQGLEVGFPIPCAQSDTGSLSLLDSAPGNSVVSTQLWLIIPCPNHPGQNPSAWPSTERSGCHQHTALLWQNLNWLWNSWWVPKAACPVSALWERRVPLIVDCLYTPMILQNTHSLSIVTGQGPVVSAMISCPLSSTGASSVGSSAMKMKSETSPMECSPALGYV